MKAGRVFIISILIMLMVGGISAQELADNEGETQFDFWSWLLSQFQIEQFSIVGQARLCDSYPHQSNVILYTEDGRAVSQRGGELDYYWEWAPGEKLLISNAKIDEICYSGEALLNIFVQGTNFVPYKEYRTGVNFNCVSGCSLQVYCCDHPECSLDSQCASWKGAGSQCKTTQCESWKNGGYKCTIEGIVENSIPYQDSSVNYCTAECTGSDINCWRVENDECVKRTYKCDYSTYPSCPATYPYTSLFSCQSNICVPDNSCAVNTCTGQTCINNCGQTIQGTKTCDTCSSQSGTCRLSCETGESNIGAYDCFNLFGIGMTCCKSGGCIPNCNCASNTCTGQTCRNSCNTADCQGTKDCNGGDTKTITWTEFYSMSEDNYEKNNYLCRQDSDCELKEGYTVICSEDAVFKTRNYNVFRDACDEGLGFLDEIFQTAWYIGTLGIGKQSLCDAIAGGTQQFNDLVSGSGTCLAESDSWYKNIWEQALKIVGSLGLPYNFVMIITIMLLITIVGMVMKWVT